jgi:hypothetical protein
MSSETSTRRTKAAAVVADLPDERVSGFQPWHLFVIGSMIASAAAAIAVRGTRPANVVFVCLTVLAAGLAAYTLFRMLWPLVEPDSVETPEMLGGRTRAALEREKTLVLRAIKELEFDRAMGKVSEPDWQDMTTRLRTRAVRLIRQLDSGSAAYREVIEKELAARQASAAKGGDTRPAGGARAAAKALLVLLTAGSVMAGSPAAAQMGGMGGGMAGMPDAKAMSGIPRPDPSVAAGTVSVRLVRGQISNNIVGHPVEFIVGGKTQTVTTNDTGHAVVNGLAPGTLVRAAATVDGERLESQDFELPAESGILMLLVATDKGAAAQMAKDAVPGTVTLGGQSRVITQFEDEVLQVYYLFDIVNGGQAPVKAGPFVFDLPDGAQNATVLQESAPNAVAKGATIVVSGPFAPGVTSIQVAYSLPPAARVAIRQRLPIAMSQVAVMVEKVGGLTIASPQMTTIREGSDGAKAFVMGTGPALKAGDTLSIDVNGLPYQPTWPRNAALALAVIALLAGGWAAVRTGGRSAEAAGRQQLELRREDVFAQVAKLDERRHAGQVTDEAFEARRHELVTELERIYGELDTEAPGPRGDQGLAA